MIAAAGLNSLSVCAALGVSQWNDLIVSGLALTIQGVAFQGVTGRLFIAEGSTDVLDITRNTLLSASGTVPVSIAQSLSYNVSHAEAINRTVGVCGKLGNSLYYSTLI
jgi:hypothetical protein